MSVKFIFLGILLASSSLTVSMITRLCKMPCAQQLKVLLKQHPNIVERTSIIQDLANKELSPYQIFNFVVNAVEDYRNDLIFEKRDCETNVAMHPLMHSLLNVSKRTMITLLLKDYPEELKTIRHLFTAKL